MLVGLFDAAPVHNPFCCFSLHRSGKSTLLRLLLRLYDPQQGKILVGGRDIKTLPPAWLREHIGFVTSVKDTYVFTSTVRENVEFGLADMYLLPEEDQLALVEEAVGKAELLDSILEMPNGINTTIGEERCNDIICCGLYGRQ